VSAEIYPSEKRISQRFKIPGATVSYRKESWLFKRKSFDEEFLPLEDLSREAEICQPERLKAGDKLFIQLSIPGERSPLGLLGKVRWSARSKTGNYPYEAGVKFNVYGEKKSQNYPGNLVKIISLEQKFAGQEVDLTTSPDEYDIESS